MTPEERKTLEAENNVATWRAVYSACVAEFLGDLRTGGVCIGVDAMERANLYGLEMATLNSYVRRKQMEALAAAHREAEDLLKP